MKTRVFGFLMVLVLLMTGTAMASVPSKTAADTTTVEEVKTSTGVALPESFDLVVTEENAVVNATVAAIKAYVEEEQKAVSTFLPQACQDEIQQKLAADKKAEELVVYDCIPLTAVNYDATIGDVTATFTFATPYKAGQTIVAVVGIPTINANNEFVIEWVVLPAEVTAAGQVAVQFDQATLSALGQEGSMMMLMSEDLDK